MKKLSTEVLVGLFMVIGFVNFAIVAIKFGSGSLITAKGKSAKAKFESIAGLKQSASIEIAGVNVGKVKSIELDKGQALVEFNLNKGIEIYQDAVAHVRTKGIIGEKYIKIDPGFSKTPLEDGAIINETRSPVDIEELISSVKKMMKSFPFAGSGYEIEGDSYVVSAKFTSIVGLKNSAPVEIAGVPVGIVEDIRLDRGKALITMRISKKVQLEDDAMASVRTKGFIGEKFIKITPGASDEYLSDGDEIEDTESVVDIEEMIGKFIYGNK